VGVILGHLPLGLNLRGPPRTLLAVTFRGFGERLIDFYEGLEADNSKAYWSDHKAIYDEHVHAPMVALLAEMAGEFGDGKVFRPYRDVRFSKDKTPYKTHCGGIVSGRRGLGGYYVQVSADGLMVACGYYETNSDQVERYREAVADDRRGRELDRRLVALDRDGFEIAGTRLKTRPRGYEADHPRIDLLRHKTLYGQRRWPPDDWLHTAEAAKVVRDAWRKLGPLNEWLDDHVGASAQPARR
jgi:uncharacterized protein (TIGR02453 family)